MGRGVCLNVRGWGAEVWDLERLEEACRRGGVWGVVGRLWVSARDHESAMDHEMDVS